MTQRVTEITDENDSIVISVRLRSGKFESQIEIPVNHTKAQCDAFVASWLELMRTGIALGGP